MAETSASIPDYPRGITFEQVWAAQMENSRQIKEMREQHKERMQETDRRRKETDRLKKETYRQMKETNRRMQETAQLKKETAQLKKETYQQMKETDRKIKEISKQLGGLGNSVGELIETLVAARLWEKFASYPYGFDRAYRRLQVFDENTKTELTDIDILLYNSDWVMAVEVKTEVEIKDVERHIVRMELIREHPPLQILGKQLLGALAGGAVKSEARNFAYESGFFILELRGESVELIPPPEGFTPRNW